jgi:hypothetical protein
MSYHTDAGPVCGPFLHREVVGAIGVHESPAGSATPIGRALCLGWDDAGVAVWELVVEGADLAGRWVVIDREFRPVP